MRAAHSLVLLHSSASSGQDERARRKTTGPYVGLREGDGEQGESRCGAATRAALLDDESLDVPLANGALLEVFESWSATLLGLKSRVRDKSV